MSDADAVNCFPAAVIMGLHGHCLGLPPEVGKLFDMNARHQAFREVLLRFAEQAWLHEVDPAERLTYERMLRSLQKGTLVWEDVSMFVVETVAKKVTVNVILGVTSMGALTVSSFAGEKRMPCRVVACMCEPLGRTHVDIMVRVCRRD